MSSKTEMLNRTRSSFLSPLSILQLTQQLLLLLSRSPLECSTRGRSQFASCSSLFTSLRSACVSPWTEEFHGQGGTRPHVERFSVVSVLYTSSAERNSGPSRNVSTVSGVFSSSQEMLFRFWSRYSFAAEDEVLAVKSIDVQLHKSVF